MINPDKDGIDHINIYSKAKTNLGKLLSNFAWTPFTCEDGLFSSIEGYWYWLGCKDDRLRDMYGFKAKKLGRELEAPDYQDDEEFKRKIKSALRCKMFEHPDIAKMLKESDLPLKYYYVFGGEKVVEPKEGKWVIEEIELIRQELKKGLHNSKTYDTKKILYGECDCGASAQPSHSCPFSSEICGNYDLCNCCENCENQCAMDI